MKVDLKNVAAIPTFTYRWPEGDETFREGWEGDLMSAGGLKRFRHGLGERMVYGRSRVHSVTWIDGIPAVEGVAADDYDQSRGLLSILRNADKTHIRRLQDVPSDYEQFDLVIHGDEIEAPDSRRGVAVKIREDDLARWAEHAVLRVGSRSGSSPTRPYKAPSAPRVDWTLPSTCEGVDRASVVKALLRYGRDREKDAVNSGPSFTPIVEANDLVIHNPFAFLLAVIFDQGVPAERAWEAPFLLRERLGHLDPNRISKEGESVAVAVGMPPKLHRYVEKVPRWLVSAAALVTRNYGGDAEAIWSDRPTAQELQRRFVQFEGIGQKKAAMAVDILTRDLGVQVSELTGSDIAYDVHVRRVFLRTCLADRDEQAHMIEVARTLHPERPGELDMPAWLIGRQWCIAGTPNCPKCILRDVCPKQVARAATVTGA